MQPIWKVYRCYLCKTKPIAQQMSSPLLHFNVNGGAVHLFELQQEHTTQDAPRGQTSKCESSLGEQRLWRGSSNPQMDLSKSCFPHGLPVYTHLRKVLFWALIVCCVWHCAACVTSVISKSIPASDSTCRAAHSGTMPGEDIVCWAYTRAGAPADSGPVIKCEANYPKRPSINIRISQDFWWNNDCWPLHCNTM